MDQRRSGYLCCFSGCKFHGPKHRDYLKHLKKVHYINQDLLLCNFAKKCKEKFANIDLLTEHVVSVHSTSTKEQDMVVDVSGAQPCRCPLVSCGQRKFSSMKDLLRHFNGQTHLLESRSCLFENCQYVVQPNSNARNHIFVQHKKANKMILKSECLLDDPELRTDGIQVMEPGDLMDVDPNPHLVDESMDQTECCDEVEDQNADDDFLGFTKVLADMLNRLSYHNFIPQTTIDIIIQNYLSLSNKAMEMRKLRMLKIMKEKSIPSDVIPDLMATLEYDESYEAHKLLSTTFKRENFIRSHFPFVQPEEIVLNKDQIREEGAPKDSFHYTSIIESVRVLFSDPTFNEIVEKERSREREQDVLSEFSDGSMKSLLPYYQENPDCYSIAIYSDAVEVVNPLGAGRGKHKVVQLFWTILDLPKQYRSRIDTIQLAVVCKEAHIKQYGYKTVYHQLVQDLKTLEKGILVEKPYRRVVKLTVPMHIGDSLENASLGGFSMCFSSGSICRHCHIQYDDLKERLHDFTEHGKFQYWSREEFNKIVDEIEPTAEDVSNEPVTEENLFFEGEDILVVQPHHQEEEDVVEETEEDMNLYGVRAACPFNELSSFHCTYSMPGDIMHDTMEGCIPEDMMAITKVLIKKGYFDEASYNRQLQMFSFKGYESNDRPEKISLKAKKWKGKALSNLTHLRNFPMILEKTNPDGSVFKDECYLLAAKLHNIMEFLMSPVLRMFELSIFGEEVIEYLDERQRIGKQYPDIFNNVKPKHHYLSHVEETIEKFGPAVNYWCARYESKHRTGKQIASSAKNFRNISKTLSERQALRMASVYYRGMYSNEEHLIQGKCRRRSDISKMNISSLQMKLLDFLRNEDDVVCEEIVFGGQKYKRDDLVVISAMPDLLTVGIIQEVVVKEGKVFFLVFEYEALRDQERRYFVTCSKNDENLNIIEGNSICDYKPLNYHGTLSFFKFNLHHTISTKV